MKKNDVLMLTAENLGADMEGVCRHEGMAVFVPGLLPGETVPVRIVKVEKRYAFGRMEAPPEHPSPARQDPGCAVYPRCGGCSCRHMTYESTLEAKRRQVQDCFRRIAGLEVEVPAPLGMDCPFAYRNKTSLPVGVAGGRPVLGFYAPRSHAVIPVSACPNAMPPAEKIAAAFLEWAQRYQLEPYREEEHRGLLRHLVIRVNRRGESMVTVVINAARLPHAEELSQALQPLGVVSLFVNENRDRTNVILSSRFHIIYGRETLTDTLCGLTFELSPASFFQVNPVQTEKLYAAALSLADLKPEETLCDVYCGAGTITLMMASHCRKALGIEIVEAAVENAKLNAERNRISNAEFRCGKAEEILPRLVADGLRPDVVVVDPPRKGLDPAVIRAIAEAKPSRVVYVSCNVATQARDAALFREAGYLPRALQPVDMFAWTAGIENVCLFSSSAQYDSDDSAMITGKGSEPQDQKDSLISRFTEMTKEILNDRLVGIYLHGSAVMGCYQPKKSDLDFLVVVNAALSDAEKRRFMDRLLELDQDAPAKGIEISIVTKDVCSPFIYPTPFILHYSRMHTGWYRRDPEDYIRKMNGTDKDLAAHFTVIRSRGRCLYGLPVQDLFGEEPEQDYLDAIWNDVSGAEEEITENPMYLILNLTRVLAYLKEKKVMSKQEGGMWGLKFLPEKYHPLIRSALREYESGDDAPYDPELAKNYAAYMLEQIKHNVPGLAEF